MKKQPQQPSMDEWLLDPIHGLEAGDEDNVHQPITPSDFLTPEAFEYFSSVQPKRSAYNIERQIRKLICNCSPLLSAARLTGVNEIVILH